MEQDREQHEAALLSQDDESEPFFGEVTWTTEELRKEFEVLGFQAPYVVVRRKVDGKLGSLEFTHAPRLYFNFQED